MHFDQNGNLLFEKSAEGDFERAKTIDRALNPNGGLRKGSPGVKAWEVNSVGRAMIDAGLTPTANELGKNFKKIPLPGRVETFIVHCMLTDTKRGTLAIREDEIEEVRSALANDEKRAEESQELLSEIDGLSKVSVEA